MSAPLDLIVAARIGLGHEPSGVVLLSRVETLTERHEAGRWLTEVRYEVPALERLSGGSSHATIADTIADLAQLAREHGAERVSCLADITACGLPFVKLLRERKVRAAAIMVGDAHKVRPDARTWHIPMRELLTVTLGLLADQRLEVADLPHAGKLAEQLATFRTKPLPKDALSDWRPVPHTDLAQALMLAAWWAERMLRSIVKQPPAPRVAIEIRPPTFDELMLEHRAGLRRRAS
ncbi:MAG: hypothetical protein AB7O44_27480 [Hyphomicrobiaceae bacterium]